MRTYLSVLLCVGVVLAVAMAEGERRGLKANRLSKKRMLKRACSNAIDNCESYGQAVCTDSQYTQWVQDNCCAFCGGSSGGNVPQTTAGFQLIFGTDAPALMTGSHSGPTMTGSCRDAIPNCDAYTRSVCTDSNYASWVQSNCPKYCGQCGTSGGTMTGTHTDTGSGTGAMASFCTDKIDCSPYAADICTNAQYTTWAKENCASKCHMCSGTSSGTSSGTMTGSGTHTGTMPGGTSTHTGTMTGSGTMSGSCSDAIPNCADYTTSVCTDPNYTSWVTQNCPKFCHKCSAPAPVPVTGGSSTTCADAINNCADYTTSVCSNPDYTTWVATNCPKYCNQCPSGSSSGTNTQPSGPAITGSSSGCVYNGQLHAQGETWKDGCKFTCECNDGTTGKYTCTEMCLNWDLPSQCSMNPPAAGKCCPTPNCPSSFTLNYPPGYVEQ